MPATSANAVGAVVIVGAFAGVSSGLPGVVVGTVFAGLTTIIGLTMGSGSVSSSVGDGS